MVRSRCLHLILYSNNLMFPKEENSGVHRSRLIYKCDNCGYMEDAGEPCIFRISYKAESRWKFVVWYILDQFLTWWTTILWKTLLSVVTRTKNVKSAMKRAACFSRLTVMETKRWRWFSCAFIVNISGLDNLLECLFQTKLRVLPIKCLVSNLHSFAMGVFNIDRNTILHLLDEKLYDSAEYWCALLLSEKNLETAENVARTILYADCLFRNEKYKQAAVSFCVLWVFLVLLSTIVIIAVMPKWYERKRRARRQFAQPTLWMWI